ncbi:beta-galactosidase [Neptunitalea chrysea]|uniref:beta-galactosidase n=1 Tax=Neptunitalea chrysea TaxID=1647581 RepID=A0A9W6EU50_9FLAO|nr:glycoside hydrolase family 2 TIM barrel-domain containing protein [Neptunitalea chrysea]GLB51246.1 beta-galactosidase [Neptunitalea chrysea]
MKLKQVLLLFTLGLAQSLLAQETTTIMLSGTDFEHPVTWDFKVTDGQHSNEWSTINVPSQWETESFGTYTYGRWYRELNQKEPSKEEGFYTYKFSVPTNYKNQKVIIHFGGAMTDTEVKINGKLAGPIHQGGFYEFSYDITPLISYKKENLLEVHVWKHSANASVNNAERKADWWLFGGIYRPVWLSILPESHIAHIAIDAKMNGTLEADIDLKKIPKNTSIVATLEPDGDTNETFEKVTIKANKGTSKQHLKTTWNKVKPWSPETPNLYWLHLSLVKNGEVLHTIKKRIGFRTLEFKKRDGIYVNGTKILMKGINRHTFWPESGRSTSKRISILDVNLIKDMNMNAVRGHYPPDTHFLEACDSLGLFVLDELAGWQNGYDTPLGTKLIKEMVERDVNHPSVIIWDQGNEGGWNLELDDEFAKYDPQNRIVIHPWADFNGWDAHHYPTYQTGVHRFGSGENVFFPTEFMHGTYDNGIGAGLKDFWAHYKESPLFAGGFIWVFSDEAVKRSDWIGPQQYDSKGNLAPDGALGPHREKEGSFYTIKEVWSPIQIAPLQITESFKGTIYITNEYLYTNLNTCTFTYKIQKANEHTFYSKAEITSLHQGTVMLPSIEPGETRKVDIPFDVTDFNGDWLELTATDSYGREIYTWTWKIHHADYYAHKFMLATKNRNRATVTENEKDVTLNGADIKITLDKSTGRIISIYNKEKLIPFADGPTPIGMKAEVKSFKTSTTDSTATCLVSYSGGIKKIKWVMYNDGRLYMKALMLKDAGRTNGFDGAFFEGAIDKFGLSFTFQEEGVTGFKWFGKGPYHVWKNRLDGVEYNIWYKDYNNTITGESFENLIYPEFKGYHANFIAGELKGTNPLRLFSESDQLFLRLFTPDTPKNSISKCFPQPKFPEGNLSFMYEIPGMRAFKPLDQQGSSSQPTNIRIKSGDDGITMKLWFDFRSIN